MEIGRSEKGWPPQGLECHPHMEQVLRARMHSPLSVLQLQVPDTLIQLLQSLQELLLLLYQNVLLPLWHILLEALARAQEHCHEACR